MAREQLNERENAFVDQILITNNQTESARLAGYSEKSAARQANKLMKRPGIVAAIDERRKARAERVQIEQDDVLRELKVVLLSNVQHFAFNEIGELELNDGVSEDAWRAVASVKRKVITITRDDGSQMTTIDSEFRFWSKTEAARLAGEHLGMYKKKIEHSGEVKSGGVLAVPVPIDAEDWGRIAAEQQQTLHRQAAEAARAAGAGAIS